MISWMLLAGVNTTTVIATKNYAFLRLMTDVLMSSLWSSFVCFLRSHFSVLFPVMRIKPMTLWMPGKHSSTKLHSQPRTSILNSFGIQEHGFILFCSLFGEYSRIKTHCFENSLVVMKCLCLSLCSSNRI